MGTYKVPQNVEAEDKILGPLSLKQFIYAMIGVGYGILTFAIFKPLSIVIWVVVGLPPMLALLALGLYQREDQPLETFVIAVAQFLVRPRVRLWSKEPIAEAFHLEPPPPKPVPAVRDSRQVQSRLAQLAHVVDTGGWSVKQPELQEQAGDVAPVIDLAGRLGGEALAPVEDVPEVTQDDDMLNLQTSTAQNLNLLIENSVKNLREEAMLKMAAAPKARPKPKAKPPAPAAQPSISGSTSSPPDVIVKLATEGGDLTVSQIAAQARRYSEPLVEGETVSLPHANPSSA